MWFKVDDKLHDHRKTRKARRGGDQPKDPAAMGLWVLAGSWCAGNETDGFVPADELDTWASDPEPLAARLVAAEFWTQATQDGEDGYQFKDWAEFQPTKAQLDAKREDARNRMRRARSQGGDVRANEQTNTEETSRAVTPTRPDPTRPKTKTPAAAGASAEFEKFWDLYPRKVGKDAAARKWATVVKRTDVATIAAGLHRAIAQWRAEGTAPEFIPHPATWLNQGRWADVLPEAKPAATGSSAPTSYDLPPLPDCPPEVIAAGGKAWTDWVAETRAAQRAALGAA